MYLLLGACPDTGGHRRSPHIGLDFSLLGSDFDALGVFSQHAFQILVSSSIMPELADLGRALRHEALDDLQL